MNRLIDWSPRLAADADALEKISAPLWQAEASRLHAAFHAELLTDEQLATIQSAHRVLMVDAARLSHDAAFFSAFAHAPLTNWNTFQSPPVDTALQNRLAEMLDIAQGRKYALIELGDMTRTIGVTLVERLLNRKVAVDVQIHDDNARAMILNAASLEGVHAVGAWVLERRMTIDTRIFVQHNLPDWPLVESAPTKMRAFRQCLVPYRDRVLGGELASVLTSIPTRADARVDDMDFDEYLTLFFRMCDQPWAHIETAQGLLIDAVNAAKTIRFTNEDGTDIALSIDGFTFCNSTVKRNIPGSEVFSAPVRNSANGTIVAKGKFAVKEEHGTIIENLTLRFKDGYLYEATAEHGQEHLDHALSVDEGARYIGEVAIGTNPYLKRHLASILLAEKIGGSFHIALGDAYQMTDYLGTPVTVDNGNRSLLHWDITTMLWGKKGKIFLDGTMIMDDGVFLDPRLAVLNFGWWAIPENERPAHWNALINAAKESP